MFYHSLMFAVLCAGVTFTVGAYFLLRHPKLVERYATWFGSLSSNNHAMFAALFGALAVIEVFDRFWFGVVVFGAMACAYAYYAVKAFKKVPVDESKSA